MICISIQGEGKIRRVTTIIFGSPSAKNFADFPQWRCKLLTGWSDDSETIVAQCHPKTQGHGHRWAGPQSRLMISWSPKYKIARSPKYDRPSCPTKILDIVTPGFSPFHRLSSLKKTIILKNYILCFHCFVAKKRSVQSGIMITMIMILMMRGGTGGRGAKGYNDNDNASMMITWITSGRGW